MDNKIEVFKNEQFGEIRTALIENEPWITLISNEGNKRGNPNMTVVNEPGLYTLILSSRKPEAKAFKRWITHEVIPTIRKTGGYMTDSLLERIQKEPAVIVEFAQALILEKNRKSRSASSSSFFSGRSTCSDLPPVSFFPTTRTAMPDCSSSAIS